METKKEQIITVEQICKDTGISKSSINKLLYKVLGIKGTSGRKTTITMPQYEIFLASSEVRLRNIITENKDIDSKRANIDSKRANIDSKRANDIEVTMKGSAQGVEDFLYRLAQRTDKPAKITQKVIQDSPAPKVIESNIVPTSVEFAKTQNDFNVVRTQCNKIVTDVAGERTIHKLLWSAIYKDFEKVASKEAVACLYKKPNVAEKSKTNKLRNLCKEGYGTELLEFLKRIEWKSFLENHDLA